jgi:hypothetical protein
MCVDHLVKVRGQVDSLLTDLAGIDGGSMRLLEGVGE